jgi:hypothetical protein
MRKLTWKFLKNIARDIAYKFVTFEQWGYCPIRIDSAPSERRGGGSPPSKTSQPRNPSGRKINWSGMIRLRPHFLPIFLSRPTSPFAPICTITSNLWIPLEFVKMSAHDNYQTPLASRYASSGECPAIPAPRCLILDRLLLALVQGEVLIFVMCTEMRELFSARKRGSTWRQLWLWSVLESLHS